MGKIFDALGRAGETSGQAPNSQTRKRARKQVHIQKERVNNVVPLTSSIRPPVISRLDGNIVAFHDPYSLEAEMFKVLRTNLLFPSNGTPPKTIMVTSAMPGDGKSFVSSNLSVCMAQSVEEHILLIDADIRNPSIDQMFGLHNAKGLSEYLSEGSNVAEHFVKTAIQKLTILPSGEPPYNPTELLTTQKMKMLLNEVKNRYQDRYIIIDTAPPALASETAAIAKYMDGILIVVRAGKTPKKAIDDVIEQLGKENILGIVFNHSDQSLQKYYGYGKSYYRKR